MTHTRINNHGKSVQSLMIFILALGFNFQLIAQEYKVFELAKNENHVFTDQDNNGFEDFSKEVQIRMNNNYNSIKDTGDIIHTISTPGGNCQGLTWDGNYLWTSDIASNMIYKLDPVDGSVINLFASPGTYSEGLAWDGNYLWACENGGGLYTDYFIYKLDPSNGSVVSSMQLEAMSWPHGITWDGQYLWTTNFGPKTITKINPDNGQILHTIPTPGEKCIGLTWDGQYLWTDDFEKDSLYQISPEDGSVIYAVVSPNTNPRDLAWDGQYLWVVSAMAWTIYQIDVGYTTSVQDIPCQDAHNFSGFPNPFKNNITFTYSIDIPSNVYFAITDINGKLLKVVENKNKPAGSYQVQWDGIADNNLQLPNGIYFGIVKTEYYYQAYKVVIAR